MNNEVQNLITLCNKKNNRCIAAALIISFLILSLNINIILKILIAVAVFLTLIMLSTAIIKNKYINPILNNELNPQKYYTVICGTHNTTKYAVDEMLVAYYMRDYNAVINICNLKIKDKKSRNYKYFFIQYLARTYFDLGDLENLRATCEKFENELSKVKKSKSIEKLRKFYGNPIEYYKNYLLGDFKACKECYSKLLDEKITNANKLSKISVYYHYAIACYRLGELDEAKDYFTVVVNEATLVGYGEIAKKYISDIDGNEKFVYDKQNIEVEESYEIPQGKTQKPDKKKATLGIIAIIMLIVIICVASAKNAPSTPEKVLKNTQGMTRLILTSEVDNEKDLFCFYDTKNNGYSAAFLECVDENKYKVKNQIDDIGVGYIYEIGISSLDKAIEFSLYDDLSNVPENAYTVKEVLLDGSDTIYFCITDIKDEEIKFSYTSTQLIDGEIF